MSSSQQFWDTKRAGKAPEKTNFVNTCNLLSQYLKEKGNFKDLSREINGKLEAIAKSETSNVTTKNLLNTIEDLNQPPTEQTWSSMESLPQFARMASPSNPEDPTNKACTSKESTMEPKGAQMTIFYDGKIWVFDGLPADRAGEVMMLASKGSTNTVTGNLSSKPAEKTNPVGAVASISSTPLVSASVSSSGKGKVEAQAEANNSDLPIARRSSLHRFLEKRKERSTARGPYQVHDAPGSSSKSDEQLELKL